MMANNQTRPTTAFWIICILALLWNIIGIMNFYMQVFISPETLAALPEAERALIEASPIWTKVVFAIAVLDGTLGCVLLLMKKAVARPVLISSMLAVLIQMTYWLFFTNSMEVYGSTVLVMPLLVISVSIFLVWYAYNVKSKGWIS
jgi:hypothetical protein